MNWSILIWIAVVIFVYVFGLFEGRGQGYKRRKAEEAEEKKNQPAPVPPAPQTVTVKVDDPGLLRIKNDNGYIALDLDGVRADTTALTSDQRKRLIEMLNLMRPWLEGKSVPAPVTNAPPPPPPPTNPVADLRKEFSAPPVPPPAVQPPAPKPATIAPEDRPVAPAGSIVSQIDSILQARLVGTPLEDRGVFLAQSAEGGVMVYVGLTKYMGVEDVPDSEIKAAIRAAIAEWENKYTPGLGR
jgi:hypothetical protein